MSADSERRYICVREKACVDTRCGDGAGGRRERRKGTRNGRGAKCEWFKRPHSLQRRHAERPSQRSEPHGAPHWRTKPDIDEEVDGGVVARAKQVEKCLETEESGCGACGACGGR
jgi:hypothetical protein